MAYTPASVILNSLIPKSSRCMARMPSALLAAETPCRCLANVYRHQATGEGGIGTALVGAGEESEDAADDAHDLAPSSGEVGAGGVNVISPVAASTLHPAWCFTPRAAKNSPQKWRDTLAASSSIF